MFGLNDGMRYYVCQRYVRMNLGDKRPLQVGVAGDGPAPAKRSRIHLLQQKPAAGETPALGHGRLHAISETSGKRDLRDTLFQYWQEGMRNTLQDPVRHTERNIVEINKISQETEHRWLRACKLLIISTIFDKIDDVIFGSLVFFSYLCSMKKER